jgi:hypothetical protein
MRRQPSRSSASGECDARAASEANKRAASQSNKQLKLGWDGSLASRLGTRLNNQKLCRRRGAFSLLSTLSHQENHPHHPAAASFSRGACYWIADLLLDPISRLPDAVRLPLQRRPASQCPFFRRQDARSLPPRSFRVALPGFQDAPNTAAGLLPSIRCNPARRAPASLHNSTRSPAARLPF